MPANDQETQEILAKHHRDGAHFAALMKSTFAQRFNEAFWQVWDRWLGPSLHAADSSVLDLGTGPGLFLAEVVRRYPLAKPIGVEIAPWMFESMSELPPSAQVITADLHHANLPLPSESVDAALASVVLHEMSQPVHALREVHRCLKPGARFLVHDWVRVSLSQYLHTQSHDHTAFDPQTPPSALDDIFTHFIEHNRFSREDLEFMLNRVGFDVLESVPLRDGQFARIVAAKR